MAEGLLEAFPDPPAAGAGGCCWPGPRSPATWCPTGCAAGAGHVDVVDAYRTVAAPVTDEQPSRGRRGRAITFTSSSTVDRFVDAVGADACRRWWPRIGPVTLRTAAAARPDGGRRARRATPWPGSSPPSSEHCRLSRARPARLAPSATRNGSGDGRLGPRCGDGHRRPGVRLRRADPRHRVPEFVSVEAEFAAHGVELPLDEWRHGHRHAPTSGTGRSGWRRSSATHRPRGRPAGPARRTTTP